MEIPKFCEPVLAEIKAVHSLGISIYFEVVYHDGEKWCSFAGSKTFNDGEQVLRWRYANEAIIPPNKQTDFTSQKYCF